MKPKKSSLHFAFFTTLCVTASLPSALMAQTDVTWNDGAANDIYSDAGNWDLGVPANDLTSNFAVLTGGDVDMSLGNRQVAGLKYTVGTNLKGTSVLEIGTGGITVNANSFARVNLLFNQPNTDITFAGGRLSLATGVVDGTGALTVNGSNVLFIDSTANTWAGGITINPGASVLAKSNGSLGTGNVTLVGSGALGSNGGNVDMGVSRTVSLSGGGTLIANGGRLGTANDITGTGPLTIGAGDNEVFLDVTNTFTGGMNIIGTVAPKNSGSLGEATGPIVFDGGSMKTNGNSITIANTRTVTLGAGGGTLTTGGGKFFSIPATISGVGQLTIAGELTFLDVPNTYEGGTVITGTASVKNGTAFGGTFNMDVVPVFELDTPILLDGGTINANNSNVTLSAIRPISLSSAGGTLSVFNNNRRISLVSSISGDGQLTIDGGVNSTVFIDTNQSYTGGTLLKGAFARPKADAGFGAVAGAVTLDGGRIWPNAAGVTFDAARSFILGATGGTLIPNGTTTFNSVISGAGSLTVSGDTGTLVLAGINTYTGDTIVNGAANDAALPGAILAVDGDSISDVGTLIINNDNDGMGVGTTSGQVQVTGIEQVSALVLNGVPQSSGTTYGSMSSMAANKSDIFFSGTGMINVVPAGTDYDDWADLYTPADLSDTAGDNDKDGLTNQQEYAYGLDPVSGSSVNPILVQVDKTAGTFTYQRRATTSLTYTVLTSPDLNVWTENIPTSEVLTAIPSTDNESVAVTLSGGPFPGKFFVRVKAD